MANRCWTIICGFHSGEDNCQETGRHRLCSLKDLDFNKLMTKTLPTMNFRFSNEN